MGYIRTIASFVVPRSETNLQNSSGFFNAKIRRLRMELHGNSHSEAGNLSMRRWELFLLGPSKKLLGSSVFVVEGAALGAQRGKQLRHHGDKDDALVKTLGVRKDVKASGISKSLQWPEIQTRYLYRRNGAAWQNQTRMSRKMFAYLTELVGSGMDGSSGEAGTGQPTTEGAGAEKSLPYQCML